MAKFFFLILISACNLCFSADRIEFQVPKTEEILKIDAHMLDFYVDQLVSANLFVDKKTAVAAAKSELASEEDPKITNQRI